MEIAADAAMLPDIAALTSEAVDRVHTSVDTASLRVRDMVSDAKQV